MQKALSNSRTPSSPADSQLVGSAWQNGPQASTENSRRVADVSHGGQSQAIGQTLDCAVRGTECLRRRASFSSI